MSSTSKAEEAELQTFIEDVEQAQDPAVAPGRRIKRLCSSCLDIADRHPNIAKCLKIFLTILYTFVATVTFIFLQVYQGTYLHIRLGDIAFFLDILSGFVTFLGWLAAIAAAIEAASGEGNKYKYWKFGGSFTAMMVGAEVLEWALFAVIFLARALWHGLVLLTGSAEVMSS